FEGSSDGKPISEIAPQASKNLHGGKKVWLHLAPNNFLPKFCEQMVGQKPGDTRTVTGDFAVDFPVKELAGKQANYNVTVSEIKQKVLPVLDDAFAAKLIPGKTFADLRQVIEHDLVHEKKHERDRAKELQGHDGLDGFAEQILLGKTLDFLKANVSVETAQEAAVKEEKS